MLRNVGKGKSFKQPIKSKHIDALSSRDSAACSIKLAVASMGSSRSETSTIDTPRIIGSCRLDVVFADPQLSHGYRDSDF
jgi:hypothetical protein